MNALGDTDDDEDDGGGGGVFHQGRARPLAILQTESLFVRLDLAKQHTWNHTQIFTHALKCQTAYWTDDKWGNKRHKNAKNGRKKTTKTHSAAHLTTHIFSAAESAILIGQQVSIDFL